MISKNDVVTIEYTGKVKDSGRVFDTTDEKIAKDNNIWNEKVVYGPVTIVLGQGFLIPGLDEELVGKETGTKFDVVVPPEKSFGRKNPKLIKLIPSSFFKKQKVNPFPGLPIMVDGVPGTILTVSPGRVIVDFNHPLAGKTLLYDVKIIKKVTDPEKIVESILVFLFGKENKLKVGVSKKEIIVSGEGNVSVPLQEKISELVKETLKNKYSLVFKVKQ